eukprot:TRINITY_DN14452_c0_g1_i1.p1 TRINITY_DN14452_c0_g1~~TRINITY_DN14452_c0_g1_i1.p1  ORF type:complete len:521 (+),score=160.75 TRINITY_DN14452_c0_g1_i1:47-1609(+)
MSAIDPVLQEALNSLSAQVTQLQSDADSMNASLNISWLIYGAALVFFMQAGFAMLEAGTVRHFNVTSILFKNTMDGVLSALLFWSLGWGFYMGTTAETQFIGGGPFFLKDLPRNQYASWLFQWAFAATAATIVSGAVAERCRLGAYFVYTAVLTAFVYPVVAHWAWSACGWISTGNDGTNGDCPKFGQLGVIDFAGSGVVHMTGGFSALAGAVMLGPRKGYKTVSATNLPAESSFDYRFKEGVSDSQFAPHSIPQQALGVFILWFGWYGFNCASTLSITGGSGAVAAKVSTTTTMGAATGGLGALLFNRILVAFKKRETAWDISTLLNGILAGLVSITAPCSVVEPWAAVVIGIVGGMVYVGASQMLQGLEIDDPLDAFPVHGACGTWGVLSVGIFAHSQNVMRAYGNGLLRDNKHLDGFYDQGNGGNQFDVQLAFAVCVALWSFGCSIITFWGLDKFSLLRVDDEDEQRGLDIAEGMGSAYEFRKASKTPPEIVIVTSQKPKEEVLDEPAEEKPAEAVV